MGADDRPAAADAPEPQGPHVYDGIVEHDNKLPLWWQWTLYGAVIFALVYWYGRRLDAVPAQQATYEAEVRAQRAAEADKARASGQLSNEMLATLARDPATLSQGKAVFGTTCAPCHRLDAGGNIGPNLTDRYWLHGNKPVDIYHSVRDGVPSKGMPTWGPQLGDERIQNVVAYVLSIKNTNVPGGKPPQGEL